MQVYCCGEVLVEQLDGFCADVRGERGACMLHVQISMAKAKLLRRPILMKWTEAEGDEAGVERSNGPTEVSMGKASTINSLRAMNVPLLRCSSF